jgi:acyl-CoA synthetase (AMP-forming)/AMP-acid ligase II
MINIPMWITRSASYYRDKTALVFGEKRLTFWEVNERANRLANALSSLGVSKGDRVASLNRNCHQHIEIVFARYKIGAVEVTLNPRLSIEELKWQIDHVGGKVLFVSEEMLDKGREICRVQKSIKYIIAFSGGSEGELDYEELLRSSSPGEPTPVEVDENEPGAIMYTGGTTGRPKGIVHPRTSPWAITRNMLLDMVPDMTSNDIFLGLQPLYHAVGTFILPCWVRGATHIIVPEFDPETALDVIEKEKVTIIKTVPTVLVRFLAHPNIERRNLGSINTIIYGASPMPVEQLKKGIEIFGEVFVQNYGQTEAPMTVCLLRKNEHLLEGTSEQRARLSSIGRPYTFVEVRIVDEAGGDVPEGEIGEVIVRGDHIMKEYWKLPEETKQTLKDGWVYTRDMARMDKDGYIYLVDRKSEMIITGGLNVYPNEVEQVLYQHPAVLEAVVFGIPDKDWGESIKAVVALKSGMVASEEELIAFCKSRLASYKKPKSIEFTAGVPKTPEGKVLRRELREPYWRDQSKRIH